MSSGGGSFFGSWVQRASLVASRAVSGTGTTGTTSDHSIKNVKKTASGEQEQKARKDTTAIGLKNTPAKSDEYILQSKASSKASLPSLVHDPSRVASTSSRTTDKKDSKGKKTHAKDLKDKVVEEKEKSLAEKEKAIAQKEKALAEKEKALAQKEKAITEKVQTLKDKISADKSKAKPKKTRGADAAMPNESVSPQELTELDRFLAEPLVFNDNEDKASIHSAIDSHPNFSDISLQDDELDKISSRRRLSSRRPTIQFNKPTPSQVRMCGCQGLFCLVLVLVLGLLCYFLCPDSVEGYLGSNRDTHCPDIYATFHHGNLSCVPPGKTLNVGSTCSFVCSEGFQLRGNTSATCLHSGLWSVPSPDCRNETTSDDIARGSSTGTTTPSSPT